MAQPIREVMTKDPVTLTGKESAVKAASAMKDADAGAIVVADDGQVRGILTDRDIVVRAVAEGRDPAEVKIGEICSEDVTTLQPDDPVEEAVRLMRSKHVRRVPVTQNGDVVGIVSIGDLAIERDADSALAEISAAPANN